jgi:hypothetical protein
MPIRFIEDCVPMRGSFPTRPLDFGPNVRTSSVYPVLIPACSKRKFSVSINHGGPFDGERKDFKVGFRTSSQVVVGHATLIHPRSGPPIRGDFKAPTTSRGTGGALRIPIDLIARAALPSRLGRGMCPESR